MQGKFWLESCLRQWRIAKICVRHFCRLCAMLSLVINYCGKHSCFAFLMPPGSIENQRKSVSRRKARKILLDHLRQSLFQVLWGSLWCTKILLRHNKKVCAIMAHRKNFYAPFQKTMRHGAHGARQNYPCDRRDLHVKNLEHKQRMDASSTFTCDLCKNNDVTVRCIDCKKFLCAECRLVRDSQLSLRRDCHLSQPRTLYAQSHCQYCEDCHNVRVHARCMTSP